MIRIISIIVLTSLLPMQLYAADFNGFNQNTPTDNEFVVPIDPNAPEAPQYRRYNDKFEEPVRKGDGINWWLWGGAGLTAIAGAVVAVIVLGGKSSPKPGASHVTAPVTTVVGSW